ncbi:MAG: hypothetical protein CL930_09125 [Deltaproteobacteria bacterium]|nr:hypothetical protein [Deltaproteobacteria bacterium]
MKRVSPALVAFLVLFLGSNAWAKDDEKRLILKLDDVGVETQSEFYRQKAREKRHQSIDFLQDLLRNNPPRGEQKAEMLLRLADLYFEEGRDVYLTEMATFRTQFDACFNTPGCNSENMKADNAGSLVWQNKSIKLYKIILKTYSQYRRADEAIFYLASALQDTDRRDEAVKQFTKLVGTYPQSQYTADSYVMIGEYYFDNNNAYKALLAYQKATKYKNSPKYAFALYKLAWCYYNVGEYGKAIDTMKAVVAFSMTAQEGQSAKAQLTLQDEALKDLVRFFADAGEMDEAYGYFTKLGKKGLIRKMLTRLASTYFEQGKFEQCIQTYRRLIAEDPQSAKAPDYQNEIILAYQRIGRKEDTLNEIKRLLDTYGKNSAWARTNSADQDAVSEASKYIEKNLRTVAINYHNEAKKLGTGRAARESYNLAEKAYTVYLQQFPTSKYSYDIRYAYGELLYKLKKYSGAYEQYMEVVKLDPKGKHSRFCAESAVFAADEMVKKEKAAGRIPKPAGKTTRAELVDWEQKLLAACDQWSTIFPDDKKTRNIIYKSAYLLYHKNQFKEASDRFRKVIAMNPGSKEAEQAADLILDSFNLVEDWKNLKDVAKAFYDQKGLGRAAFKKNVYNVYERASFKLIEVNFANDKNALAAAEGLMGFYAEFPKSEVADQALNNAAVYYHQEKAVQKAMETRLTLVTNFPKSKFYNDTIANLGFDYENIADFEKAAEYYEKLFTLDKKHQSAKEAIYSAALFRKSMNDANKAIKDYRAFIVTFPDDERVNDVKIVIAKILEKHDKWSEAAKLYKDFYTKTEGKSADELFFAKHRYGLALEKQGRNADSHWKQMVKDYDAAKAAGVEMIAATEFTAQTMAKLARPELNAAMALKINGPDRPLPPAKEGEVLKKQLIAKAKAVQAIEGSYLKIIQTGAGEFGLAALVDLGQLYEDLASTLRESYTPPSLTEDQKELYKMGLEDKAYPNEEKAVQAYTQALQKSYELNLYNENTALAVRRLGELRPNDYPGLNEDLLTPRYTSKAVVESTFETNL